MLRNHLALLVLTLTSTLAAAPSRTTAAQTPIPRTADGKPDFQGIWQASSTAGADLQDHAATLNMLAGRSVVVGGELPYQPWAAAKKAQNFRNRQKADPLNSCYIPGVPRVMYLDFPFQIFQTQRAIAMAFEWSLDYRLIYTDGSSHPADLEAWMGDSRGHWDGDTLVVDVANNNDKTWFDMAGDFHSNALHVIERYTMTGPDTIRYEATIEDAKVFIQPWTIRLALNRRTDRNRLFEYVCQAEVEEANGAFTREERTWYPGNGSPLAAMPANPPLPPLPKPAANIHRAPDGKPDFQGFYEPDAGGANYGLEKRIASPVTPGGRGVIIDPPDGKLPMQPWAVEERASRNRTERGYDDPTAHCFPGGLPRSMYIPTSFEIIQTPDYVVFLHERVAWRIVRLNARAHLPETIRLWQGDSIGHWEGDTLVVDTTNFNGKTWLNEGGEIVSYAEHVMERFTPIAPDVLNYQATVLDPVVYTRPWTISISLKREKFELTEAACHEEDDDLPHLKALKDAAAARALQANGTLAGCTVVATVMSNLGLEKALERERIRMVRTPVGDKYVLEEMLRLDAMLGGEQSGHVIFRQYATTGDGMLTALHLFAIARQAGTTLDEITAGLEVYPQRLVNVRVREKVALDEVPSIAREIRRAEEEFAGAGRVLVRYSGTEPLARVMVEGPDLAQVEAATARIAEAIRRELGT